MRTLTCFMLVSLGPLLTATPTRAADKAKLVSNAVIYNAGGHNSLSDLIRFKDQWYCAFREGPGEFGAAATVRVITSKDGKTWEKVTRLRAGFPRRGYQRPLFTVTPKGQLMLTTRGSAGNITILPQTWLSKGGREWTGPHDRWDTGYQVGSVVTHKGKLYSFSTGCICGNAQTVQLRIAKKDKDEEGQHFVEQFEETFSGFFPGAGALVFDGDNGYCILSRGSKKNAYLGKAKAPFDDWTWTAMKQPLNMPRAIRTPDGRILVTTVLYDGKRRLSLCQFDPKTTKLTELTKLPAAARIPYTGLAYHKGHAWVTYHAEKEGKMSVWLAKVLLAGN